MKQMMVDTLLLGIMLCIGLVLFVWGFINRYKAYKWGRSQAASLVIVLDIGFLLLGLGITGWLALIIGRMSPGSWLHFLELISFIGLLIGILFLLLSLRMGHRTTHPHYRFACEMMQGSAYWIVFTGSFPGALLIYGILQVRLHTIVSPLLFDI